MTMLIGLGGKKTAGKDVVADHLVAAHGFVKLGMSDPLADSLYILNPRIEIGHGLYSGDIVKEQFIPGQLYWYRDIVDVVGYVEAKTIIEVRQWLQVLGTEVGRELLGEDVWVQAAKKSILAELNRGSSVVITGVRFSNELLMVESLGGFPVYVWRDLPQTDTHPSENGLDKHNFEFVIRNTSTLEALRSATDEFLRSRHG